MTPVTKEHQEFRSAYPSWPILFLYFISGGLGIAYEVLWSRMMSMQFGVSIFGVVLAVTAFMLGLGAGSLLGARWAKRVESPLKIFGLLEIAIALYALLLPSLLQQFANWQAIFASEMGLLAWYVAQGLTSLMLLALPAGIMGAGFAMVLRTTERAPHTLAQVYGVNTLGGVLGALFPLWGLTALGWSNSVRLLAFMGLIVGGVAMMLAMRLGKSEARNKPADRPSQAILLMYAGIGAGSIMLEIGWIRLYGMVMLRTEYVLAVILAVFLMGIAAGSLLARQIPQLLIRFLPVVAGLAVMGSVWALPTVSAWIEQHQFQSLAGALGVQVMLLVMLTLPVTMVLGVWLPFLNKKYSANENGGIWLYGVNCFGGVIGALAASLVLIPAVGSIGTVLISGLIIAALAFSTETSRWKWPAMLVLILLAWPLHRMPPVHDLLPKMEAGSRDLNLYEDAIALTHVVEQQDGQRILLSDLQRMDASTDPAAVAIQMDQARLPLLLHGNPHSVLFLGLGTGVSMAGSLPFPNLQRTAVELSQGSINAAQTWFEQVNAGVLKNSQVFRDDARHFLNATDKKYDVIIGDLFHPDIAGMGSLLSLQQFQRAKNHLNTDGIFVQWVALNQFDTHSMEVVLRTFQHVFPDAQVFMDGMHLALVGPQGKFRGANALLEGIHNVPSEDQGQATGNEGVWTWAGRYWGPIAASSGKMQDEWVPYVEYQLPRARYNGSVDLATMMVWMLQRHPTPEEAIKLFAIPAEQAREFGRAYIATELTARSWVSAMEGDAGKSGKLIWLAYQANPRDRWIANALADNMLMSLNQALQHGLSEREALQRILQVYPESVGALRALWKLEQAQGNEMQAAVYRAKLQTLSPLDREIAGKTPQH